MTVNSTTQMNSAALSTQNKDSVNSSNSFSTMMQQLANQLLNTVDTNKDGSIDKTEFSTVAQQLSQNPVTANIDTSATNLEKVFNSLDANGDGNFTSSELMSALENSTQQSSKNSSVYHDSQSGASASQDPTASAMSSTTAQSTTPSTNSLQSLLMKNVLSAYNISHSQSSGSSLSVAV